MGNRGVLALFFLVVGAIIGAIIGYGVTGGSGSGLVVGLVIGAAIGGALPLLPTEGWEAVGGLFELLDCCSALGVLVVTGVVTIGGFVFWHNILVAALAGGGMLLLLFIGLLLINLAGAAQGRKHAPALLRRGFRASTRPLEHGR